MNEYSTSVLACMCIAQTLKPTDTLRQQRLFCRLHECITLCYTFRMIRRFGVGRRQANPLTTQMEYRLICTFHCVALRWVSHSTWQRESGTRAAQLQNFGPSAEGLHFAVRRSLCQSPWPPVVGVFWHSPVSGGAFLALGDSFKKLARAPNIM